MARATKAGCLTNCQSGHLYARFHAQRRRIMSQPAQGGAESPAEPLTLKRLLASLEELPFEELDPSLDLIELREGEVLFEQGHEGDSLYIVVAGVLGVRVRHEDGIESVIDKLAPGSVVGEMALLSGQPRSATVFAVSPSGLLRLSKAQFEEMSARDRAGARQISDEATPRWQRLQLASVLHGLFGELDTATLHEVQGRLEWQQLSNGDILFRQGDESDGMYIVISGRLRVAVETPGGDRQTLSDIEPGETVGEYALLTDEPRSASVYAARETTVARLSSAEFTRLVNFYPALMGSVTRMIVERQQRALKSTSRSRTCGLGIAVLPISEGVDGWRFANELAESLARLGPSLALNAEQFDVEYGLDGAAQLDEQDARAPSVAAWLSEREANHDYLVYAADREPGGWTRRCLGWADRVLLLADPRADPQPGALEEVLRSQEVPLRSELVLWHEPRTESPGPAARWLAERPSLRHHHLRQGEQASMDRLARWLTGQTIGLVLSGGGARGLAHFGVRRAMDELAIPVDYYAGTSMGALVAAVFAMGLAPQELEARGGSLSHPRQIFDRTLPLTALNTSRRVTRLVQELFGDIRIEDLWQPYFCVSTNLSRAEPVVHQDGLLWRAVRASIAIPGVFTPVMEDGEVLVDGGVMDNFPLDTMTTLTESDRIIGVHVSPHVDARRHYDMDTSVSGWRILASRLNPFARPLRTPTLTGTILRTLGVNSAYRQKQDVGLASLVIQPDVQSFGFSDYASYQALSQAGYEAAIGPLSEWKAALSDLYSSPRSATAAGRE
jgi:predicted acylesterase/phospholipase RssA/CRP-like cAMP-binding protein